MLPVIHQSSNLDKLGTARVFASVRILTALAMLGSIYWQIEDRLLYNLFRPGEYFAYFTIDSSMVAAVALAVSGIWIWAGNVETRLLTIVRLSVTSYAVVVSIVYNALLRGMPNAAIDGDYQWPVPPNEILHVWAPIIIALDWLLAVPAVRLRLRALFWVLVFPLAWVAFSIVRGFATDWWPYWFINPGDEGGVTGMLTYIFGIMIFMIVVAFLALVLSRLARKLLIRD